MRLASNSRCISSGTPLPGEPTLMRRPARSVSELSVASGILLARRVLAVEQPQRLEEQAAQRLQALLGRRVLGHDGAAALHEAQVGLALAQQALVGGRPAAGHQHHLDAVARQLGLVALAEFVVGALRRAGGQRTFLGGCGSSHR
jgi:hypothetical protein